MCSPTPVSVATPRFRVLPASRRRTTPVIVTPLVLPATAPTICWFIVVSYPCRGRNRREGLLVERLGVQGTVKRIQRVLHRLADLGHAVARLLGSQSPPQVAALGKRDQLPDWRNTRRLFFLKYQFGGHR